MASVNKLAGQLAPVLCKISLLCKRIDEQTAVQHKLSNAEFRFLKLFYEKYGNGSSSIKDFRALLNLTPGRMTHIITALERKKFIKRKTFKEDKRYVLISVTPKIIPMLADLEAVTRSEYEKLLSKVAADKRDDFVESVKLFVSGI